ncbi:hypothetical protein MNBD_BACTEROID01-2393 [hydrothermal vent metagenome]|uniref:Uncharacterized protein n=1 Tax=hydrothermal vent metagenome TaxID=652676 RepID=A0A3B0UBF6_9ZZZZ
MKSAAKVISFIFHPALVTTLGFILLFNSSFFFSILPWEVKKFVLIVVFLTTGLLPVFTMAVMALNPRFSLSFEKSTDRVLPLVFSAIYYSLGYYLLDKLPAYSIFKILLLATTLVIILLLLTSYKWKVSNHLAGLGGLLGTVLALSFRMGVNPVFIISGIILLSGVVGTSQMILGKYNLPQIFGGFAIGFSILYLVVYFI